MTSQYAPQIKSNGHFKLIELLMETKRMRSTIMTTTLHYNMQRQYNIMTRPQKKTQDDIQYHQENVQHTAHKHKLIIQD